MKSFYFLSVQVLLFAVTSFTSLEAAFLDPSLNAWMSTKNDRSLLSEDKRSVIVFLKKPGFQDRSGATRAQAIRQERLFSNAFLKARADEIQALQTDKATSLHTLWSSNALVTRLNRAALKKLLKHSTIDGIIENKTFTLEEPPLSSQKIKTNESISTYGLQVIHAEDAWKTGVKGEGVVVGVIDTGVDVNHPDLAGKIVITKDFTEDNDNVDYHGHGTHVSGTIAGGNASGKNIGVAPQAKIMMAKVFNRKGQGNDAALLKAMEWMLDPDSDPQTKDAPRIVSNSWGSSSQFTYGFKNIVQAWRRFGVFPNFAAGNSGSMYFTVGAPGSYPFSFAVGAVDEKMNIASFSSRGPTLWRMGHFYPSFITKPNVSAPGVDVFSAAPGGKWQRMSGTSMATPHVAGVIALALQVNKNISIESLENILTSSALDRGKAGKDNKFGFGVVQADKVVAQARTISSQTPALQGGFKDTNPAIWDWDTP